MTENTEEIVVKSKRGRKPIILNWPVGEFTADQVLLNNQGIKVNTVFNQLRKLINNNKVTTVRSEKHGRRKISVYKFL